MAEQTRPDWVVEGAEVATYRRAGPGSKHPERTTIKRVAGKSFLTENGHRFPFDGLSIREGSGVWAATLHVASIDSDEAQAVMRDESQRKAFAHARAKVSQWETSVNHREPSEPQVRQEAIAALQALAEFDESEA